VGDPLTAEELEEKERLLEEVKIFSIFFKLHFGGDYFFNIGILFI